MAREKWRIGGSNLDFDYAHLVGTGWTVANDGVVVEDWQESLCRRAKRDGLSAASNMFNTGQVFVPAIVLDGGDWPEYWDLPDRTSRRRLIRNSIEERWGDALQAARVSARQRLLDSDYDDLLTDGFVLGDAEVADQDREDMLCELKLVGDEQAWVRALRERAASDGLRLREMNAVVTGYRVRVDEWKFPLEGQPTDRRLVVFVGPPDGQVFTGGHAFPGSLDGPPAKADAETANEAIRSELAQVWGAKFKAALGQARLRSAERQTDQTPQWAGFMT